MLRRFSRYTDAHPLVAMLLGLLALLVIGAVVLASDTPTFGEPHSHSTT